MLAFLAFLGAFFLAFALCVFAGAGSSSLLEEKDTSDSSEDVISCLALFPGFFVGFFAVAGFLVRFTAAES